MKKIIEIFGNLNRKQRIIVSITGIFLVLLILVGLTYAYFLTQITGNTNNKSISLSTANLSIKYNDNSSELITSTDPIIPGQFKSSKTFTVENDGNGTVDSYGVTIEDLKISYTSDMGENIKAGDATNLAYPEDFVLTLTCNTYKTSDYVSNGTNATLLRACNGISEGGVNDYLPTTDEIIVTNSINKDEIQVYVLTIEYVDSGTDQSADMNKTIEGKIDIVDTRNTVDIAATLANATEGYSLEVHSDPKVSYVDRTGKAKVVGVLPGEHTIYIKDANGVTKSTKSISIVKGLTEGINGNTITIADNTRKINLSVNSSYEISIGTLEASKQLLKDAIINNALLAKEESSKERTIYSPTPLTTPAVEVPSPNIRKYEKLDTSKILAYAGTYHADWYNSTTYTYDDPINYNSSISCEAIKGKYVAYGSSYDNMEVMQVGECVDGVPVRIIETNTPERVLTQTEDNYGTSYYYRGKVKDNYVEFNNMCWRIVRIEGDSSIKIILAAQKKCNVITESDTESAIIGRGHYGYSFDYVGHSGNYIDYVNSLDKTENSMKYKLEEWLVNSEIETSKLKKDKWCLGNTAIAYDKTTGALLEDSIEKLKINDNLFVYDAYRRLKGIGITSYATLRCDGENDKTHESYIGALTADEAAFTGSIISIFSEPNTYLKENVSISWWTLSPSSFEGTPFLDERIFCVSGDGNLSSGDVDNDSNSLRPAITLASGTVINGGDGTIDNPYIVG